MRTQTALKAASQLEDFLIPYAEACIAAGAPGRAHGLRKAGATRAANNGASESELEAIFGWRGGGMASLYARKANRESSRARRRAC